MLILPQKEFKKKKFIIHSTYGELLDLAMHLQNLGHEIVMHIPDKDSRMIGDGLIEWLLI